MTILIMKRTKGAYKNWDKRSWLDLKIFWMMMNSTKEIKEKILENQNNNKNWSNKNSSLLKNQKLWERKVTTA